MEYINCIKLNEDERDILGKALDIISNITDEVNYLTDTDTISIIFENASVLDDGYRVPEIIEL